MLIATLFFFQQTWSIDCRDLGSYAIPWVRVRPPAGINFESELTTLPSSTSGYLESCRTIVTCTRIIANAINSSIPELYVLGSPPASVVAFASRDPSVDVLEVGDAMSKRGWHLNGISGPPAVHIACTVSSDLSTATPN